MTPYWSTEVCVSPRSEYRPADRRRRAHPSAHRSSRSRSRSACDSRLAARSDRCDRAQSCRLFDLIGLAAFEPRHGFQAFPRARRGLAFWCSSGSRWTVRPSAVRRAVCSLAPNISTRVFGVSAEPGVAPAAAWRRSSTSGSFRRVGVMRHLLRRRKVEPRRNDQRRPGAVIDVFVLILVELHADEAEHGVQRICVFLRGLRPRRRCAEDGGGGENAKTKRWRGGAGAQSGHRASQNIEDHGIILKSALVRRASGSRPRDAQLLPRLCRATIWRHWGNLGARLVKLSLSGGNIFRR